MPEKPVKSKDVVSLNVETNLQTTEGRIFLNQINKVSRVLHLKDSMVEFKGEQLLKTGYIADFKSVIFYKCPNGYFIFGNKAFGKNNWSATGHDLDEVVSQVADDKIKKMILELKTPVPEAA